MYGPLEPYREWNLLSEDKTYVKSMLSTIEEKNSSDSRVLGVRWNPKKDVSIFDLTEVVNFARDFEPIKRNGVSFATKFYDPFGYLSPTNVEFKLFFP